MLKSILFSMLTVSGACLSAGDAFACGRGASCAAPASAVPADPHADMQMSQGNRGMQYQSFSYEPGTAPRISAPAYRTSRQPSFYDSVRGDRKIRGIMN